MAESVPRPRVEEMYRNLVRWVKVGDLHQLVGCDTQ